MRYFMLFLTVIFFVACSEPSTPDATVDSGVDAQDASDVTPDLPTVPMDVPPSIDVHVVD